MENAIRLWSFAGDWMNAVNAQTQLAEFLELNGADKVELVDCWEKVADLNDMDSSVAYVFLPDPVLNFQGPRVLH